MRTFLFILCILVMVCGGLWCRFSKDFNSNLFGNASQRPIFSPKEICELISFDVDGQAGYLLEKGYVEKPHRTEDTYLESEGYIQFPIDNVARVINITDEASDFGGDTHIVFNKSNKDAYLNFIAQFTNIKSPFPKPGEHNNSAEICVNCVIIALGYKIEAEGYVVQLFCHIPPIIPAN